MFDGLPGSIVPVANLFQFSHVSASKSVRQIEIAGPVINIRLIRGAVRLKSDSVASSMNLLTETAGAMINDSMQEAW